MSPESTTKAFLSALDFLIVSFAELSSAFTKLSAFFESVMLKFAKILEVAIIVPLRLNLSKIYYDFGEPSIEIERG